MNKEDPKLVYECFRKHYKYNLISFINTIILVVYIFCLGLSFVLFGLINTFNPFIIVLTILIILYFVISYILFIYFDSKVKMSFAPLNYSFGRAFNKDDDKEESIILLSGVSDSSWSKEGKNKLAGMEKMEFVVSGIKHELDETDVDADLYGNYIIPFLKLELVFILITIIFVTIYSIILLSISNDNLDLWLGSSIMLGIGLGIPFSILYQANYLKLVFVTKNALKKKIDE